MLAHAALLLASCFAQQFESPEAVARYKAALPESPSPIVARLREPSAIWYTRETRPLAFIRNHPAGNGRDRPILVDRVNLAGPALAGANEEFPWRVTGGVEISPGVKTLLVASLPPGARVTLTRDANPPRLFALGSGGTLSTSGGEPTFAYDYPEGAVAAEVICQVFDGDLVPFEIRARVEGPANKGTFVLLRPFPTPEHLIEAVARVYPDWESLPDLAGLVAHLRDGGARPVRRLGDLADVLYPPSKAIADFHVRFVAGHRPPAPMRANNAVADRLFGLVAAVDTLPPIEPAHARKLLEETPFVDATGMVWADGPGGEKGFAPTASTEGHVVPKDYLGAFIEPTSKACNACHETAGLHVDASRPGRTWYGFTRGGGGVFSLHFWDERSIAGEWGEPPAPAIDPRVAHLVDFRP